MSFRGVVGSIVVSVWDRRTGGGVVAARFADVDDYISSFPIDVQRRLEELRSLVHECIPSGGEKISYQIPTVTLSGAAVVYFAGWKKHLSLYPVPRGDDEFEREVAPYRAAKDAVHLPYDQPLPRDLVTRIVSLLVQRHSQSAG